MGRTLETAKRTAKTRISTFGESFARLTVEKKAPATGIGVKEQRERRLKANGVLSLLVTFLSFWENELYREKRSPGDSLIASLRAFLMGLTILQLVIISEDYRLARKARLCNGEEPTSKGWMFAEIAITCPVAIPFYDFQVKSTQIGHETTLHLDDFLLPFCCLRLIHSFRLLPFLCSLSSRRSRFHIRLQDIPDVYKFAVKYMLTRHFLLLSYGIILTNTLLGGLFLRVFERSLGSSDSIDYASNGFWLVEVSERTIGYGDIVPHTHIGRFLVTLCVFIGISNLSLTVSWFSDQSSLSHNEMLLSIRVLNNASNQRKVATLAVVLIQRRWRLWRKSRRNEQRFKEFFEFLAQACLFRRERIFWQRKNDPDFHEQLKIFDRHTKHSLDSLFSHLRQARICEKATQRYYTHSDYLSRKIRRVERKATKMKVGMRRERTASGETDFRTETFESTSSMDTATPRRSLRSYTGVRGKRTSLLRSSISALRNMQKRVMEMKRVSVFSASALLDDMGSPLSG